MEYSSGKTMTRKEYIKSKQKGKWWIRLLKYFLLITVIVLLSIYLFRQLNIYNNVTKMANKVIEETALAKTMTMYYVASGYTKDSPNVVMLYKQMDSSRTKITGSENFKNIKIFNGKIYGIVEGNLYSIDLETMEKQELLNKNVVEYVQVEDKIYFYSESEKSKETGIYVYSLTTKDIKQLINITVNQMLIDDKYIFVVAKGKTEKSVVRYNLNGSGRTVLTTSEIVTHIKQDGDVIYFIANNQLYRMNKNGKNTENILKEEIYIDLDIKQQYNASGIFNIKDDVVYYMDKAKENYLCAYNIKTGDKQVVTKKNVESLQLVGNMLYYKINNDISIYRVNITTGIQEKITGIRGTEYICFN